MPLVTIADLDTAEDVFDRIDEAQTLHLQYDQHLAKMEDDGPERLPGIHASEVSKCYRQAVYTMVNEEKGFRAGDVEELAFWRRVLDHGTYIHEMTQTHLARMAQSTTGYLTFVEEARLHPDLQPMAAKWNIHSSADGIFTFLDKNPETWRYEPRLRVGLEIKSMKSTQFDKLREPKPEHLEQVHIYMAVLDLPLFWLLYYNKDNQNITPATPPWLVRFDSVLWSKLEARFQMFYDHVAAGTLPDKMPGMHCGFCPYKWTCKPPKKRTYMPRPKAFKTP